MARSSKTGGKAKAAPKRKARPVKDRNPKARPQRAPDSSKKTSRKTSIAGLQKLVERQAQELREARQQQAASSKVLHIIGASPGALTPVFQAIVKNAVEVCGARFGAVFKMEGNLLHLVADYHLPEAQRQLLEALYPMEPSRSHVSGRAVLTRATVQIPDTEADKGYWRRNDAKQSSFRSLLATPLLKDDRAIGAIVIYKAEPGPFPERQLALLQNFAAQAVIAVENARLFNETKEALERQTATADILKVIASSPSDVQPVFEAIADRSNRLIESLSTAVYSIVEDTQYLMAFTRSNPEADAALQASFPRSLSAVTWGSRIRTGEIVQVPDFEATVEWAEQPTLRKMARLRGFRGLLLIPLRRDGATIGVISVTRKTPGAFAEHHVQLLRTFADQAVIAIENTRLFNETKEALARQTATSDVLKVIASSPSNLQPVFGAIAERSNELMGGHATAVFRFISDMAEIAALTSVSEKADAALRALFPRPIATTPDFVLISRGEMVETVDALADTEPENSRNIARARGFRSRLIVPLKSDDGIIGCISVTRKQPGAFAGKDVELLQTFADQAVIAIKNVELFKEVQARTNELTESLEQQTATSEVLQVISSSQGNLEPVFQVMLEKATHVCGANFGTMNLWDGESFNIAARHNVPPAFAAWRQRTPIRPHPESGLAIVVRTHQVAHFHDLRCGPAYLAGDPANVAMVEIAGARTIVTVPMLKENTLIGTLSMFRQEVRPFTAKQIALVENFTKQAVMPSRTGGY